MSEETPCQHPGCGCHAASHPPLKKPFTVGPGFVLICLASVIVIAVIVYILVPVHLLLGKENAMTRSLANARFIGMTLNIFAHDNAGQYPQLPSDTTGEGNANLVYRQLVPFYLNKHKEWFHLEGSAWTPKPLGEIVSGVEELLPGENHYAYVPNLTRKDNAAFPLVADGFTEDRPGVYSREPGVRGSVVDRLPVVIRIDGSAVITQPDEQGRIPRNEAGGDYFSPAEGWLSESQRPLNPAK